MRTVTETEMQEMREMITSIMQLIDALEARMIELELFKLSTEDPLPEPSSEEPQSPRAAPPNSPNFEPVPMQDDPDHPIAEWQDDDPEHHSSDDQELGPRQYSTLM